MNTTNCGELALGDEILFKKLHQVRTKNTVASQYFERPTFFGLTYSIKELILLLRSFSDHFRIHVTCIV